MFRQTAFFSGRTVRDDAVKDLAWFGPDGHEVPEQGWFASGPPCLGMYLDGLGIRTRGPRGEALVDDSFLLLLHAGPDPLSFVLPGPPWATSYDLVLDTATEQPVPGPRFEVGTSSPLVGRSVALLRASRGRLAGSGP